MTKVTIRQVLEVIQTSETPHGPTAVDVAALLNEDIRRQAVRCALQRAISKGLLVRSGSKYRLATRPKSLKIRRRHTIGRKKLKNIFTSSRFSKSAYTASRNSNLLSSSEETRSSRLVSVRDSIELNRHWCYKKCSSDLENRSSKTSSKRLLIPDGAKEQVPSSIKKQVTNTGLLECDNDTSKTSIQANVVENTKNFNCWSYLRFW